VHEVLFHGACIIHRKAARGVGKLRESSRSFWTLEKTI